jgi:cytochrome c peroxidase
MSLGVRPSMEVAAVAGFRFIQFHEPEPGEIEAVQAYLRSLEPEPSPYLAAKGALSDRAKRGKAIFEGKGGCAPCHPAPLFTDLKLYNVGTRRPLDQSDAPFDTPTLVESYRTAPYLHNGEAVTLQELFTKFNDQDKHGSTKQLSKEELDDLVEYLLSL